MQGIINLGVQGWALRPAYLSHLLISDEPNDIVPNEPLTCFHHHI